MVQLNALPAPRHPGATGAGRRINDLLRAQIANGTLPPGARAPSTRTLAAELRVSRATVTAVYEQLAAESFLLTAAGRAARVTSTMASGASAPVGRGGRAVAPLSRFGRRVQKMVLSALPNAQPVAVDFLYGLIATKDLIKVCRVRVCRRPDARHESSDGRR